MFFHFINIVIALYFLLSLSLNASQNTDPLVIHGVTIFDGEKKIDETVIIVRDGMIYDVTDSVPDIPGAVYIDGNGKTLLPGLIDSHVHVFGEVLESTIAFGVTTVLDMFTEPTMAEQLRREQNNTGATSRADLYSAGILVTAPGGHGTQFGLPIPTIQSSDEAAVFVKDRLNDGSDYIKIVYDNGSSYGLTFNTLNKETLSAVIRETHRHGKLAVVHISSLEDARDAVESGADGLVHIFHDRTVDESFIKLALEHDVFIIPTLTVIESAGGTPSGLPLVQDERLSPYILNEDRQNLERAFPLGDHSETTFSYALESTGKLYNAGVRILAGSDAPNPGTAHGISIHRELELLVQSGMSPTEALAAATSFPAAAFHLNDRGRIKTGYRADLLLVNGDPFSDITETRNIDGVWKMGVPVNRDALRERAALQLAELEASKSAPPPPGLGEGIISDFEDGTLSANFGYGWEKSTDAMMGGNSTVDLKIVEGGAGDNNYSLLLTGEITGDTQFAWAGAMFFPGNIQMGPANLSSKSKITFYARGDGRSYSLLVFSQNRGMMPSFNQFTPGAEWQKFSFDIASFDGIDGSDITGLTFSAGPPSGTFEFQLDNIRLE